MNQNFNDTEIFNQIQSCLADSQVIPKEDIKDEGSLINELGVDSLDLLDILFQLERIFSVKLRGSELDKLLQGDMQRNELTPDGYLGPKDIEELAQWFPAINRSEKKDQIEPKDLFSYITVESLVILIQQRIKEAE